jgi:hypothetical protein
MFPSALLSLNSQESLHHPRYFNNLSFQINLLQPSYHLAFASPSLTSAQSQLTTPQSIPSTRHYFTKILCGYHDEDDKYGEPAEKSKANQSLKPIKVHGKFMPGSSSASTGPAHTGEGSGS